MNIFDSSFGIKPQALMIAHMLNRFDSSQVFGDEAWDDFQFQFGCSIKSFPYYNGREAGIIIEVRYSFGDQALYISFGENRNSDSIFVQHAMKEAVYNNPQESFFTDEEYYGRRYFSPEKIYEITNYIKDMIKNYFVDKYHTVYKAKKAKS